MKTLTKLLLVSMSLIVTIFIGCKKEDPPVPNFSFSGDNRPAPCEVTFLNLSTKYTSVNWEFGDGGNSMEINPKHTYASGGAFTVKLTAIGAGGNVYITKSLIVQEPIPNPVADFSFNGADGFAPRTVTFTNKSQNAVSYLWDFGDGQSSSDMNPAHLYSLGGTFNVTLTAKNSVNVTNSVSKSVLIGTVPNPVADFSFTGADGFAPRTVTFTNKSQNAVSYSWDFGDGQTSTEVNPSHLFSKSGTYSVSLTAKNSINASNVIAKSIVIAALPNPVADFSFAGANSFAPRTVSFTNKSTGAVSYSWDFGDGSSGTNQHPSHLYRSAGNFNVTLSAINSDGLEDKITKTVTIKSPPTQMSITKVVVTKMPFNTSTGAGWDLLDGPDVFFKISDDAGNSYFTSDTKNNQTLSNLPISFTSGLPFALTRLDYKFRFELWDYDNLISSDYIGGYYFTARDYMPTNGELYPALLEIGGSTQAIHFTISVSWQ